MLAFAPLAGMPLAGVISGGFSGSTGSPAWRRLLAETDQRFTLNRQPPVNLVWHDPDEEEEAILLELIRIM